MPPVKESYSIWSDFTYGRHFCLQKFTIYINYCLPNYMIFNNPHSSGDFTKRRTVKLEKSYSIFLRTICFGKEDGFFLLLPRTCPVSSLVLLGLLFPRSAGVAKGEISLISTGGGDQQLSFSGVLKRRCNSSQNKHTTTAGFPTHENKH